jgi:hypothetical protein
LSQCSSRRYSVSAQEEQRRAKAFEARKEQVLFDAPNVCVCHSVQAWVRFLVCAGVIPADIWHRSD